MERAFELVGWVWLAAFGAVGLTIIVRNAPLIRGWVQQAKKPWACNVCMPLYLTAVTVVPLVLGGDVLAALTVYPGAYALANMILDRLSRPPAGPPPGLASLVDSGEDEEETGA